MTGASQDSWTPSEACLLLARLPLARAEALLRRFSGEKRERLEAELRRWTGLTPAERQRWREHDEEVSGPLGTPAEELPTPPIGMAPEGLARLVQSEHPAIAALLLEEMPPLDASRVLLALEPGLRAEVARRIASQGRPATWVPERLRTWLSSRQHQAPDLTVPGRLGRILSQCPEEASRAILEVLATPAKPQAPADASPVLRLAHEASRSGHGRAEQDAPA